AVLVLFEHRGVAAARDQGVTGPADECGVRVGAKTVAGDARAQVLVRVENRQFEVIVEDVTIPGSSLTLSRLP
ncbi:MAG TPA: hypothetical protein VN961_19525, partial [Streptosporangiaceae bacterium]|nr:hypothetical protein [Streptosporangiaceae bacterium]